MAWCSHRAATLSTVLALTYGPPAFDRRCRAGLFWLPPERTLPMGRRLDLLGLIPAGDSSLSGDSLEIRLGDVLEGSAPNVCQYRGSTVTAIKRRSEGAAFSYSPSMGCFALTAKTRPRGVPFRDRRIHGNRGRPLGRQTSRAPIPELLRFSNRASLEGFVSIRSFVWRDWTRSWATAGHTIRKVERYQRCAVSDDSVRWAGFSREVSCIM